MFRFQQRNVLKVHFLLKFECEAETLLEWVLSCFRSFCWGFICGHNPDISLSADRILIVGIVLWSHRWVRVVCPAIGHTFNWHCFITRCVRETIPGLYHRRGSSEEHHFPPQLLWIGVCVPDIVHSWGRSSPHTIDNQREFKTVNSDMRCWAAKEYNIWATFCSFSRWRC